MTDRAKLAAEQASIIVRHNAEHNGVEIRFPDKPAAEVRAELKGSGFKWSPFSKVWYKKLGAYSWSCAHRIAGISEIPPLPTTRQPVEDMAGDVDRD